jgi:HSP20 family protein
MSSIIVRNREGAPAQPSRQDWDPMRWARDLLRWDPFREMMPSFPTAELAFAPAFEVKETKDGFVFKADVPGVKEQDLDITHTGNRLTITGKREAEHEEKSDTYYASERSYGSFTRAFTLPDGVDGDHVRAELNAGVLTIVVPKLPEAQPKKISVGTPVKKS